jgi:Esterase-like activity of phytase
MKLRWALLMLLGLCVSSAARGVACDGTILTSDDPLLTWRSVTYPGGKYASFTLGIGSGASRNPADPADVVHVIADRGPNFTCEEAADIIGPASTEICPSADADKTRVYPTPDYTPSIYRLELDRDHGTFAVKDVVSLKTASGKSISGLLNPQTAAAKDSGIDLAGKALRPDVNAVDAEAIAKLSDGTFWISEEMAPSLLHAGPDGRIIKRFVPANAKQDYDQADTEIVASLPNILSKRKPNRGIEALTVSPDKRFLYFVLQSPLANPDEATYKQSQNVRLFKFDLGAEKLVGEYVYRLDDPKNFGPDVKQKDLRVSDLLALGDNRLLVLERTDERTRLYEIVLNAEPTNILGTKWDDVNASPTLEALADLAAEDVHPVTKVERLDSAPERPPRSKA